MKIPIAFDTWTPGMDTVALGNNGLSVASNVVKLPYGYGSRPSFSASALPALAEKPIGDIGAVRLSNGLLWNYVGTQNHIYRSGGVGWPDLRRAAYGLAATDRWDFCQFNDYICAVAPGQPMEEQLGTGGVAFAAVANAPQARCCMSVGEHVVLGDVVDTGGWGLGTMRNGIWWSARGNHASWLQPGTAAAIAAQTDYRQLSEGGDVMALVATTDSGLIFQQYRVARMDYVGGSVMYEIHTVVPDKGVWVRHGAINTAVGVFFIHSDGLYLFDGSQAIPVGGGAKLTDYFENGFDYANAHNISMGVHPIRKEVWIGHQTTSGNINFLAYNWLLDEFTFVNTTNVLEWIMNYSAGIPPANITDDIELWAFDTNHDVGSFTGTALPATMTTGDIEAHPGRRSTLVSVRPMHTGAAGTVVCNVGTKDTAGVAPTWEGNKTLNSWGNYDYALDARYHRIQIQASGAWDSFVGVEAEFVPSGEI
jgi:hypothetical protein